MALEYVFKVIFHLQIQLCPFSLLATLSNARDMQYKSTTRCHILRFQTPSLIHVGFQFDVDPNSIKLEFTLIFPDLWNLKPKPKQKGISQWKKIKSNFLWVHPYYIMHVKSHCFASALCGGARWEWSHFNSLTASRSLHKWDSNWETL